MASGVASFSQLASFAWSKDGVLISDCLVPKLPRGLDEEAPLRLDSNGTAFSKKDLATLLSDGACSVSVFGVKLKFAFLKVLKARRALFCALEMSAGSTTRMANIDEES